MKLFQGRAELVAYCVPSDPASGTGLVGGHGRIAVQIGIFHFQQQAQIDSKIRKDFLAFIDGWTS